MEVKTNHSGFSIQKNLKIEVNYLKSLASYQYRKILGLFSLPDIPTLDEAAEKISRTVPFDRTTLNFQIFSIIFLHLEHQTIFSAISYKFKEYHQFRRKYGFLRRIVRLEIGIIGQGRLKK